MLEEINSEAVKIGFYDQGVGFPANEIDKAFDKFYQTSRTKTGAGGTGLGLSICKEIVDLHDGNIWIESPPAGRDSGSVIYIQLPNNSQDCT